VKIGPAVPEIC